jgi:hypothetical protein
MSEAKEAKSVIELIFPESDLTAAVLRQTLRPVEHTLSELQQAGCRRFCTIDIA